MPLNSIIVFTLLNATLAMVFDLEALVEFLSIGTLLAYSVVSACVLILRHQPAPIDGDHEKMDSGDFLLDFSLRNRSEFVAEDYFWGKFHSERLLKQ